MWRRSLVALLRHTECACYFSHVRGRVQCTYITLDALGRAESLPDGLSGESPLRRHLAKELDDVQKRQSLRAKGVN